MLTIEKGVPMTREPRTTYPWPQMEVGDSIHFAEDTYKLATVRQSAYKYGKAAGKRFAAQRVEGGFRVWRVAPQGELLGAPPAQGAAAEPTE